MQIAKEHAFVFKSAKCHIKQPQIAFYGTVFTAQDLPTPILRLSLSPF